MSESYNEKIFEYPFSITAFFLKRLTGIALLCSNNKFYLVDTNRLTSTSALLGLYELDCDIINFVFNVNEYYIFATGNDILISVIRGNELTNKLEFHLEEKIVCFDVDNNNLIVSGCSNNICKIWDIRNNSSLPTIQLKSLIQPTFCKWCKYDNNILLTVHQFNLYFWDIRNGNDPLFILPAHDAKITAIDWCFTKLKLSLDDKYTLLSSDCDGIVKFWNSKNLNEFSETSSVIKASSQSGYEQSFNKIKHIDGFPQTSFLATYNQGQTAPITFAGRHHQNFALNHNILNKSNSNPYKLKSIHLWNIKYLIASSKSYLNPVHSFVGSRALISDFDWRKTIDDNYEIVSWGQDKCLRIWTLPNVLSENITGFEKMHSSPPLHDSRSDFDDESIQVPLPNDEDIRFVGTTKSPTHSMHEFHIYILRAPETSRNYIKVTFKLPLVNNTTSDSGLVESLRLPDLEIATFSDPTQIDESDKRIPVPVNLIDELNQTCKLELRQSIKSGDSTTLLSRTFIRILIGIYRRLKMTLNYSSLSDPPTLRTFSGEEIPKASTSFTNTSPIRASKGDDRSLAPLLQFEGRGNNQNIPFPALNFAKFSQRGDLVCYVGFDVSALKPFSSSTLFQSPPALIASSSSMAPIGGGSNISTITPTNPQSKYKSLMDFLDFRKSTSRIDEGSSAFTSLSKFTSSIGIYHMDSQADKFGLGKLLPNNKYAKSTATNKSLADLYGHFFQNSPHAGELSPPPPSWLNCPLRLTKTGIWCNNLSYQSKFAHTTNKIQNRFWSSLTDILLPLFGTETMNATSDIPYAPVHVWDELVRGLMAPLISAYLPLLIRRRDFDSIALLALRVLNCLQLRPSTFSPLNRQSSECHFIIDNSYIYYSSSRVPPNLLLDNQKMSPFNHQSEGLFTDDNSSKLVIFSFQIWLILLGSLEMLSDQLYIRKHFVGKVFINNKIRLLKEIMTGGNQFYDKTGKDFIFRTHFTAKQGIICTICGIRVKGRVDICPKCSHGGHPEHVRDWFIKRSRGANSTHFTSCPTGCGCLCITKE